MFLVVVNFVAFGSPHSQMKNLLLLLALSFVFMANAQPDYQNRKIRLGAKPELRFDQWIANVPADKKLEGKFIVLEFWATWCEPCLRQVKHLNELQSKINDPKIYFISITDEDRNTIEKLLKKVKFNSIVVSDKRQINSFWNGGLRKLVIPFTLLIDDKGVIKWIGDPALLNEKVLSDFVSGKLEPFSIYESRKL